MDSFYMVLNCLLFPFDGHTPGAPPWKTRSLSRPLGPGSPAPTSHPGRGPPPCRSAAEARARDSAGFQSRTQAFCATWSFPRCRHSIESYFQESACHLQQRHSWLKFVLPSSYIQKKRVLYYSSQVTILLERICF